MNKKLTREEKERLYIEKQIELQRLWDSPVNKDAREGWDFTNVTDELLEKKLKDVTGEVRFNKAIYFTKKFFKFFIYSFVVLGILGLLVFGIKQLF